MLSDLICLQLLHLLFFSEFYNIPKINTIILCNLYILDTVFLTYSHILVNENIYSMTVRTNEISFACTVSIHQLLFSLIMRQSSLSIRNNTVQHFEWWVFLAVALLSVRELPY